MEDDLIITSTKKTPIVKFNSMEKVKYGMNFMFLLSFKVVFKEPSYPEIDIVEIGGMLEAVENPS